MSELPDTWAQVPISEIAEVNPRKSVDLNGDDLVSFVPMAAVDEVSGTIAAPIDRPYSEVSKGFTHFRDEDVIFAKITPSMENGKSAVARDLTNGTGMGSTEFHVFRSYGAIEPEYLWRYVRQQSFRDDAQTVMSGAVGQQRVPADWLKEHLIPLAPMAEQRRIVKKVGGLTACTARARESLETIPKLMRQLRDAHYSAAFELEAPRARLSEVTPVDAPIIYGILQPGPDIPNGIPYVRPTEIENGFIDLQSIRRTSPEIAKKYRRATINEGDIILSIVGTIGKVALVTSELSGGNITQSSCRIRPDINKVDKDYLRHWLQSPLAWAYYKSNRLGSAVPRLNLRDIRDFELPLPPLATQHRLAAKLNRMEQKLRILAQEADRARSIVSQLESAIFAKAFRGGLVSRDPDDEPASALLKRIAETRSSSKALGKSSQRRISIRSRTPGKAKVVVMKSRHDLDVWQKPYLAGLLKQAKTASSPEELFSRSELELVDFYHQLSAEYESGWLVEVDGQVKAA